MTLDLTLISMRAWIDHWLDDRSCGLLPTEESLRAAHDEVDAAISALASQQNNTTRAS